MDHQSQEIRVFGREIAGKQYVPRPGAYAVILDGRRLAVIRTAGGYFLPGGGCDDGEAPVAALRREVREECGREVEAGQMIGEAVEYLFAEAEGRYYRIDATFFEGTLGDQVAEASEPDHVLMWLEAGRAIGLLARKGQAWAVQRVIQKRSPKGAGNEHRV